MTIATPNQHTTATATASKPAHHHHRRPRRSRETLGLPLVNTALKESCLKVLWNEYNRFRENPENIEPLTNNLSRSLVKTFLELIQAYIPWLTRDMFYGYLRKMKNVPPPTTSSSSSTNNNKKTANATKSAKQTTATTTGALSKSSGRPSSQMIAELKECCLEFVGKEYNELKAKKPKHSYFELTGGSIPPGGVKKLLESTKVIFPWITRDILYNYLRKMKKKNDMEQQSPSSPTTTVDDEASNASTTAAIAPPPLATASKTPPASNNNSKAKGGRRKGDTTPQQAAAPPAAPTTMEDDDDLAIAKVMQEAVIEYAKFKDLAKLDYSLTYNGVLAKIIKVAMAKHNVLPSALSCISSSLIKSRVNARNFNLILVKKKKQQQQQQQQQQQPGKNGGKR